MASDCRPVFFALFLALGLMAGEARAASPFLLREPLDAAPDAAPATGELEEVRGRQAERTALKLSDGAALRYEVDAPTEPGFIEFWMRPARWDAVGGEAAGIARFRVGDRDYRVRKVAEAPLVVLEHAEADGEAYERIASYPIYNWTHQPWMSDPERERDLWHLFHVSVTPGGPVRLHVDGFPADHVAAHEAEGALSHVELVGDPGNVFSSLHVVASEPLDAEALRGRYRSLYRGEPELHTQTVTVPKTDAAPDVDGRIDAAQWSRAVRLSNFNALGDEPRALVAEPITVDLMYDDEHLYMALRTPYEGELRVRHWDERDAPLWREESYEIFIMPPWTGQPEYVQLVGNPFGDQTDLQLMNRTWGGRWTWQAQRDEGQWDAELRAHFRGIDMSPPEDGAVWAMNIINDRANAAWSFARRYHDEGAFGVLRFEEDPPIVRAGRLEIDDETIAAPLDIIGARDPRALHVQLEVYGPDDILPARFAQRELRPGSGESVDLRLSVERGDLAEGTIALAVRDDEELLYYQSVAFPEAEPTVREPYPDDGPVAADESEAEEADETEKADVVSEDSESMTDEQRAYARTWSNEELGEALRQSSEWMGSDIGLSDEVPSPWTPMEVLGQRIECWGRTYEYDDSILPTQITSRGRTLFHDRSRFVLERDGQRLVFDEAAVEIEQVHDGLVRVRSEAREGPFTLRLEADYEFDGMGKVTWTLNSPDSIETVDRFYLEFALDEQHSPFYHLSARVTGHPPGTDTRRVPAEGKSFEMFRELVWLGDEEGGFCWFAEDLRDWRIEDERGIQRIGEAADGGRTLRIEFAHRTFDLDEPWGQVFGIQATPTRPRMERWRERSDRTALLWQWFWGDGQYYPFPSHVEVAREQIADARADGREVMPASSLRYFGRYRFFEGRFGEVPDPGLMHRAVMLWGSIWQRDRPSEGEPLTIPQRHTASGEWYGERYAPTGLNSFCAASSFQDYYVWRLHELVEQTGLGAIYLDQPMGRCDNPHHGCGYIDYRGQWRASTPFFEMRRMTRRIRQVFYEAHGEALIRWHSSNQIVVPALSFADVFWDGENYNSGPMKVFEFYSDILPEPRMRIQHSGFAFGYAHDLLPQLEGRYAPSPASVRDAVGLFSVHDSNVWDVYTQHNALVRFLQDRRLGHDLDALEVIHYWDDDPRVRVDGENVRFILHHGPERALLILHNRGEAPVTAAVELDLAALGMSPATTTVRDTLTDAALGAAATPLEVPILPRDLRMLTLEADGDR